ncbi:MAG: hypothetical protein U9R15_04800 [Chloroflexota bacterium]|nr:hypothetical protein [Chloroflexota bacterium]
MAKPTEETQAILDDDKIIVTVENRYGRTIQVNKNKAKNMVANDGATIISTEALAKLEKAVAKTKKPSKK